MLYDSKLKQGLPRFLDNQDRTARLNLAQVWLAISHHKWSILFLSAIVAFVSMLITMSMPSIYKAKAVMLIEPPQAKIKSLEEVYSFDNRGGDFFLTQVELLRSRDLVARVIEDLDLARHAEFGLGNKSSPESNEEFSGAITQQLVNRFLARLSLRPVNRTHLVEIFFESSDPKLAARVANHLVEAYLKNSLENQMKMASDSSEWLTEKIVPLKTELSEAETRLQNYLEKESLADIQGVRTLVATELNGITNRLVEARAVRSEAENLVSQTRNKKDWQSIPSIINNDLVKQSLSVKIEAEKSVSELKKRYGPDHPRMQSALSGLEVADRNLLSQMGRVVEGFKKSLEVALKNEKSLVDSLDRAKKEVIDINRKEFQLRELQREVDTRRRLYDAFFVRFQETNVVKDFEPINARITEHAAVPLSPYKPARKRIVTFAFIVALLFSIGLAVALEFLKSTFKSAEDVAKILDVPFLGYVPYIKTGADERLTVEKVFAGEGVAEAQEFVNSIRTSLLLGNVDAKQKVTIVTSSVPEEGKSIVSGCIAAGLSQLHKTLLIDADLRRPTVHKLFSDVSREKGLGEVLAGECKLKEALVHIEPYGLDVLPVGMIPPKPLDLLSSGRLQELLKDLAGKYEHIILDTPPVHAVSDALVLSRLVHDVVFVTRFDATSHYVARKALTQLQEAKANIVGVVLNQYNPPSNVGSYGLYRYMYKYGN